MNEKRNRRRGRTVAPTAPPAPALHLLRAVLDDAFDGLT